MTSELPVILYQYDTSPFFQKINNILTLKGIEHKRVQVSRMPPRPALSEQLGIGYRRIPVLAIGRDVYVDTSLIALALERCFPEAAGFGTIFPARNNTESRDTGLVKALAMSYADRTVFKLATMFLPWDKMPADFVKDRSSYLGSELNPKALMAMQPVAASMMSSHLSLLEEQLADGREWLFDTRSPSYVDISLHFIIAWISPMPAAKSLHDVGKLPKVADWLQRMSDLLTEKRKNGSGRYTEVKGDQAGQIIVSSSYGPSVNFDAKEARVFGLSQGVKVLVAPDDTGRDDPTRGTLVGFTLDEAVIETSGAAGTVRVHFPRLGFTIRPAHDSKL